MFHAPEPQTEREMLIHIYTMLQSIQSELKRLAEYQFAQNGRIGTLERWQYKIVGGAIAASAIVGLAVSLAVRFIP